MATIITRAGKGSPLENAEVDANFTNLNDDKLESTDLSVSTGAASGGGTLSYAAGVFTFAPADLSSYITDLSSFTTTDLTEGTNLYYTNERVDDRVNALIVPGLGITTDYNDAAGTLTIESETIEELCKNGTGSTILKGTPVYQTGTAGNFMEIAPADASSAATMPAVGVLAEDLTAGAEGTLLLMGRISGLDTSAFNEGDVIYVASGGGYTNTRPTGESVLVQNLGRVTKVNPSNGGGVVMGSGRSNDVPNLADGNIFIGNASGTYDKRAIVVADISDLTATATELNYTDGVTSSIQTQLNAKAPTASPTFTGTVTADGLSLGDNDKATFGNGNDLEIYHDGSNSFIRDAGTGNLVIRGTNLNLQKDGGESYITMVADGAVTAYYDNSAKLATTSTGIDVTGTATMDGLTVDGNTTIDGTLLFTGSTDRIRGGVNQPFSIDSRGNATGEGVKITANSSAVALFDISGDISFYEDTGTTPKFFWDASAESLGIGTSSPSSYWVNADDLVVSTSGNTGISIVSGTTSFGYLIFADSTAAGDNTRGGLGYDHAINNMLFRVNNDTKMTIDSSGNVGIGTTSVPEKLSVNGKLGFMYNTSVSFLTIGKAADGLGLEYSSAVTSSLSAIAHRFSSGITPNAMVMTYGGNVGIGTTSPAVALEIHDDQAKIHIRDTRTAATGVGGVLRFQGFTSGTGGANNFAELSGVKASGTVAGEFVVKTSNTSGSLTERMRIDSSGTLIHKAAAVFNEDGGNSDFRVESDSNTHALFVDASTNTTAFGSSNPQTAYSFIGVGGIYVGNGNQPSGDFMSIDAEGGAGNTHIKFYRYDSSSSTYEARLSIAGETSETIVNDSGLNIDFRVESDTNAHALFVDAGNSRVGVGTNSPLGQFHVSNTAGDCNNYFQASSSGLSQLLFSDGSIAGKIAYRHATDALEFTVNTLERLSINAGGRVTTTSSAYAYGASNYFLESNTANGNVYLGNINGSLHLASNMYYYGGTLRQLDSGKTAGSEIYMSAVGSISFNRVSGATAGSLVNTTTSMLITENGNLNTYGSAVFNQFGNDNDFIVESDTNTHALFVNAGTSRVGIGTGTTNTALTVNGSISNLGIYDGAYYYSPYEIPSTSIATNSPRYIILCRNDAGRFINGTIYGARSTSSSATRTARYDVSVSINSSGTITHANVTQYGYPPGDPAEIRNFTYSGINYIGLYIGTSGSSAYPSGYYFNGIASSVAEQQTVDDAIVSNVSVYSGTTGYTGLRNQSLIVYDDSTILNENGTDADFRVESDTNAHALFVDASANCVGFNKSSPSRTVDIEGASDPLGVKLTAGSNPIIRSEHYSTTNANWYHIRFFTGLGAGGAILVNGSTGTVTYSTTSDYRLKENVVDMTGAIDRVKALNPVRFNWKQVPNGRLVDGFIAHEVSEIVPEAVAGEKDAIDENGNIDPQGIDQAKLVPLLTAALQEAIKRIETLEAEVSALKP